MKPQTHVVVVDTNILWDEDKTQAASPAFQQFWEGASQLVPLELRIPEVVVGELQFQQATSAFKAASSARRSLADLSGITSAQYAAKIDENKIKNQVRQKLERWMRSLGAEVVPTPLASIEWQNLQDSAIWRLPPFQYDAKDKDNEKGFRDALILETVVSVVARARTDETVIFVCNDALLRTASEARLKGKSQFLAFESIIDFNSYLLLAQQQLTDKFVQEIQAHARLKFFLFYTELDIWDAIRTTFASELAPPEPPNRMLGLLGTGPFEPLNRTRRLMMLGSTQFQELVGERSFHWKSTVHVIDLLEPTSQDPGRVIGLSIPVGSRIRVLEVFVRWKANVRANGRFHDVEVIGLERGEIIEEPATADLMSKWGLSPHEWAEGR